MALQLSDKDDPCVRHYARPAHRPHVVQLCPLPDAQGRELDAIALALAADGKIYGVDAKGALFILGVRL